MRSGHLSAEFDAPQADVARMPHVLTREYPVVGNRMAYVDRHLEGYQVPQVQLRETGVHWSHRMMLER